MKISKTHEGTEIFNSVGVRTVENYSLSEQNIDKNHWKSSSHLKNLPIATINNERPLILINQESITLIAASKVGTGPGNSPIATKCKLSRSLHGPILGENVIIRAHTLHVCD